MAKLSTQQTGRCGELLVQYMLLKHGVESAPLTTDTGVDLVAFPNRKIVTIQVKTSTHHTAPNDPTCKWLLWEIPNDCPADLERQKLWLLSTEEFIQKATRAAKGRSRLLWYIPGHEGGETEKREEKFKTHEMDTAILKVFGLE